MVLNMLKYSTKRLVCPVNDSGMSDAEVYKTLQKSIAIDDNCVVCGVARVYITSIYDNESEAYEFSPEEIEAAISIGSECFMDSTEAAAFPNPPIKLTCNKFPGMPLGKIKIGNNCTLQGTSMCCYQSITIGNNVMFGPNVVVMDSDGHALTGRGLAGESKRVRIASVTIEDDVWLGYGCIILPGVTIGRGAVIGAGSVVVNDISAGYVAVGNPCREVRRL